jgi:16S rRNA (guanine527-N7)-methyltransferase
VLPEPADDRTAIDLGSGAGFPGLPMKLYAPNLRLTLLESRQKKAAFLKEAVRTLGLPEVQVFAGRAEEFPGSADLVTMRAVERFGDMLPLAASLLRGGVKQSQLCLLIGVSQVEGAQAVLPDLEWQSPIPTPESDSRVVLVGSKR